MTYRQVLYSNLKKQNKYLTTTVIIDTFLYYTKKDLTNLSLSLDNEIEDENIIKALEKIETGEPVQYVLGEASFLSRKFKVNSNVLIPRQETEQLVMDLVSMIMNIIGTNEVSILDIGTGSGCIAISMKLMLGNANVFASDISKKALEVAKENDTKFNSNVTFYESDIFQNIPENKFDVIISNPPYVDDEKTIDEQVLRFEPHLALMASPSTYFYEEIFKNCKDYLKSDRFILGFEIGENMEESLTKLVLKYFPDTFYKFSKDIYERTRFLYIIKS